MCTQWESSAKAGKWPQSPLIRSIMHTSLRKEKPPYASGGELQVFFVFTHIGLSLATVDLQSRLATPEEVS